MGKLISIHNHSTYSDGKNTPEEMINAAIEAGIEVFGFSEHSFVHFDPDCGMSEEAEAAYKSEIRELKEKYKDRLEILMGIELDLYTVKEPCGYDFIIGSNHYVKTDGGYVIADHRGKKGRDTLTEAAGRYFGGDIYSLLERYFEETAGIFDSLKHTGQQTFGNPSLIIGHFDLISTVNEQYPFFDPSHPRYIAAWKRAADRLLEKTRLFEINYSDVMGGTRSEPYPSDEIRRYIKDRGGEFICTGDCHSTERIFSFAGLMRKMNGSF